MTIKKRIIYILASFSFLLAILVICTPALLSSNWMQKIVLSSINREINGALKIESMHLSWLGPQKINRITLTTQKKIPVASANFMQIDRSLFAFLISPSSIRNIKIDGFNVEIGSTLVQTLGAKYFPLRIKDSKPIRLINTNLTLEESQKGLKLAVSGSTNYNNKAGSIQFDVNLSDKNSLLTANITHFPVEVLDICASLSNPGYYGIFQHFFGDTLNLIVKDEMKSQQSKIQLQLDSKRINLSLNGMMNDNHFRLTAPAAGSLVLSPSTLKDLLNAADLQSPFQLVNPLKVDLVVKDAQIPMDFFRSGLSSAASQNIAISLSIKTPQFEWELDQRKNAIRALDFQIAALAGQSSFDLNLNGEFYQDGKPFPFSFKSIHRKPTTPENLIASLLQPQNMSFALNRLKTKNLDNFLGLGSNWTTIFGNTISFHLFSEDTDLHTLNISLDSDGINIPKMQFKMRQSIFLGEDFLSKPLSGVLSADRIVFKKENSSFDHFNVDWKGNFFKKVIAANFSGNTRFKNSQIKGKLTGDIYADFTNVENPSIQIKVNGNQIPAPFLSLVSGRKEWGPIFGPALNLAVDARMKNQNGPVKAEINGSNGKLIFHGRLSNGILTLQSPLRLSTKATPELGKNVLSGFAPVFGQMISADQPISFDIEPEAFSIPLTLNYSQMNFKLATLNLGKVTFQNKGDVSRLLKVLKAENPLEVEAWTTPVYLSMNQGTLTIYRTDMLVLNRYPIAAWGNVDFAKNKVNTVLGLSPMALAQSLGITNLPKDYMLQIPIKGSTTNTKINSTMVMSRIGALVAQNNGGPHGLVLGTVWDIANGREPKIPKPTTQPFPWGDINVKENKSSNDLTNQNPLQSIPKEAKKLIKGIFR